MTENNNRYCQTENNILLFIDGESLIIGKDHQSFKKIEKLLNKKEIDWEQIKQLSKLKISLLNYIGDRLKIIDGEFIYQNRNGTKIKLSESNSIISKILAGFEENRDYMCYVRFLDNLLKNPRRSVRDTEILDEMLSEDDDGETGLFKFLEDNELQITEDGCFLAFKKVRSDFKDIYSGTFDNSIGKVVRMKREDVELNREKTCSTGLHFCSRSYLSAYSSCNGEDKIVIVKVNPKDVISIPVDYNNAKGRCCCYEVIGLLENKDKQSLKDFVKPKKQKVNRKLDPINKKDNQEFDDPKVKLDKKLPVFSTVEEMRKEFKPRKVNAKCYVYNSKKGEYRLYQFIDGTANVNLKCVGTLLDPQGNRVAPISPVH